ncbi:hypothetical protein EYR40_008154 [Pleurotus pulmonarius]|nr:hypothetical protein EYR38_007538 [Pleurotus pulmonarius]KAF4597689.1 hypothetical protein EYR40_008154 [Pleurotus pulmonarius]
MAALERAIPHAGPATFKWCSEAGHILFCKLLKSTKFPHEPHTYQVEGVCKALDGVDLFAITPTGSGKTGFYSMYILLVLLLAENPSLAPYTSPFPRNPCLLVICPTVPLQLDMEARMKAMGLETTAINSLTRDEANRRQNEELWQTARKSFSVIISGPEQLRSREFASALDDDDFSRRICGVGFDEVHLLNSWGRSFRKDFQQMGFLKSRMHEKHNPWILTTATCQMGDPFDSICTFLGLESGRFHLIHRLNRRSDIQILVRELLSGINGDNFPELDWVLVSGRSTLIFAKTIALCFRIYSYLFRRLQPGDRDKRLRMYNSLNWDSFNAKTREYLLTIPGPGTLSLVVIGTDTLSVGVDMLHCEDAIIIIGDERDADIDDIMQKIGRAGRHPEHVSHPRGIIYHTRTLQSDAEDLLDADDATLRAFAQFLLAPCKTKVLDSIYDNPANEDPCRCSKCSAAQLLLPHNPVLCCCSGCVPEAISAPPKVVKQSTTSKDQVPRKLKLIRPMREHGTQRLIHFRLDLMQRADIPHHWMLPPDLFLPDTLISSLLNHFHEFFAHNGLARLQEYIIGYELVAPHAQALYDFLLTLKPDFDEILASKEQERVHARATKRNKPQPTNNAGKALAKPQRPPTAFTLFLKTNMEIWKRDHPDRGQEAYSEARLFLFILDVLIT